MSGVFGKGMHEGNKGWSLSVSPVLTILTKGCKDYHSCSVTTEKNKLTEVGETCKRGQTNTFAAKYFCDYSILCISTYVCRHC
ncbi:hypothetical protein MKX03_034496 [Papaver bracteatum]|nr:hypothetical protein MKX03_034496 [Papaver bracteatum]